MPLPIFPISVPGTQSPIRGLAWPMKRSMRWNTGIQSSPSGARLAVPYFINNPLWDFEFSYEYLLGDPSNLNPIYLGVTPPTDLRILEAFYMQAKGTGFEFAYQPPDSVITAQALANPDVNHYTELVYTLGGFPTFPLGNPAVFTAVNESVQELNSGTPQVFANGVNQVGLFTLRAANTIAPYEGYVIDWGGTTPTPPITANFTYYYRVAFADDMHDYEDFMFHITKLGKVKLSQIRVVSL